MNILKLTLSAICKLLLCYSLAFSPLLSAAKRSNTDLTAPKISQSKYISTVKQGKSHQVTVQVTDNTAVKKVQFFYRKIGTKRYQHRKMKRLSSSSYYQTTVAAKKISAPGIEYYIQATDTAGNIFLHGYSFSPLKVKMLAAKPAAMISTRSEPKEGSGFLSNKWLWIGLGVLAVGAASSGSDGSGSNADTASLTISANGPIN